MSEVLKDRFEEELEKRLQNLQNCQSQKGFDSCLNCAEIFECQTRKNYVSAVYSSMAKGEASGGFDF